MKNEIKTPAVYVGTFKKYNEGNLSGAWVELDKFKNQDEFMEYCIALHKDEEDPEIMFQDYENIPKEFYSDSEIKSELWDDYLSLLLDYDKTELDAYLSCFSVEDLGQFEERRRGKYDSDEKFTQDLLNETDAEILDILPRYLCIDWEFTAKNIMADYYTENGFYFCAS